MICLVAYSITYNVALPTGPEPGLLAVSEKYPRHSASFLGGLDVARF
jgi:hypothetical protein